MPVTVGHNGVVPLLIVGRGDPIATATTLASLSFDDPELTLPGYVVIVDDRPGYASSPALTDLAKRFGALSVAADEFAGWAAVDIGCDSVQAGPMMIVEAGVIVSPARLRACLAAVAHDPRLVFASKPSSPDVPFDVVVIDRRAWPRLPAFRGFGGIGDALQRHWHAAGLVVQDYNVDTPTEPANRISTVESRATTESLIRNALVAEHWLDGDHRLTVERLSQQFDPHAVESVSESYAIELASPFAELDAVYWLPGHVQQGGWPAAEAAFACAGIAQIVRRLPRIEVSLTGEVREAMTIAAIARRAVTRRWERVAIIEGAFEVGPFSDRPLPVLPAPGEGADVLFLDDTIGLDAFQQLTAVMLGPLALREIGEAVPRQLAAVGEWVAAGWSITRLLADRIGSDELSAATVETPLVRRVACIGLWSRW
jgi:hypothetical protein